MIDTHATQSSISAPPVNLGQALAVLTHVFTVFPDHSGRTWDSLINRAIMEATKPVEDIAYDTLTDHLADILASEGILSQAGKAPVRLLDRQLAFGLAAVVLAPQVKRLTPSNSSQDRGPRRTQDPTEKRETEKRLELLTRRLNVAEQEAGREGQATAPRLVHAIAAEACRRYAHTYGHDQAPRHGAA